MEPQQIYFLIILGVTLALFISEKIRIDLVAMLALLALNFVGILSPQDSLAGFSSEPAIIASSVFVLSAGLTHTGITNKIGELIGKASGHSEWRTIAVVMPATALLSSFTHHVMITAMMLPILIRLAQQRKFAASRLLMPMSLAASLGTTLTLISAPAFLLASDLLKRAEQPSLDIFSVTPIGIVLVVIGLAYMLVARLWLPKNSPEIIEESEDDSTPKTNENPLVIPLNRRAPIAILIMLGSIAAAVTEFLAPQMAFLAGAVAMVLTGCVGIQKAYQAIDVRIFVMIAGVIPLGIAMEKTGTAAWMAGFLMKYAQDWSVLTLLLVMFTVAGILTQILSDAATTVLLAPIALVLAQNLGLSPTPFVVCTAMGAVASFLTPIGHHGNLLILTAGKYTFGDFLRIGGPLTLLIGFACAWVSRWLWLGGNLIPSFS